MFSLQKKLQQINQAMAFDVKYFLITKLLEKCWGNYIFCNEKSDFWSKNLLLVIFNDTIYSKRIFFQHCYVSLITERVVLLKSNNFYHTKN